MGGWMAPFFLKFTISKTKLNRCPFYFYSKNYSKK